MDSSGFFLWGWRLVFLLMLPRLACIEWLDFRVVVHALQFSKQSWTLKVFQTAAQACARWVWRHHVIASFATQCFEWWRWALWHFVYWTSMGWFTEYTSLAKSLTCLCMLWCQRFLDACVAKAFSHLMAGKDQRVSMISACFNRVLCSILHAVWNAKTIVFPALVGLKLHTLSLPKTSIIFCKLFA